MAAKHQSFMKLQVLSFVPSSQKEGKKGDPGKGGGEELKRQQFQISEERNKDSSFAPF